MNFLLGSIKLSLFLMILCLIFSLQGCSERSTGIKIVLKDSHHLEEVPAGCWIKEFDLKYNKDSKYITRQIHDKFVARGVLIDKYSEKEHSETFIWNYHGPTKGLVVEESVYKGSESLDLWITIRLGQPGTPWQEIIPDDYSRLKPNRNYENAVVINSNADRGARLFLFGWGNYCTHISLF